MSSDSDMINALLHFEMGHEDPWPARRRPVEPVHPSRRFGLLGWYAHHLAQRHLAGVRLSRQSVLPPRGDRPLVVYLNHSTWWDPLLAVLLAQRYFRTRRHTVFVDAATAHRFRWFGDVGLQAMTPGGSSAARRFIRASRQALDTPDSVLWLVAPGTPADPRTRPTPIEPALAHLARHCDHAGFLPLALEYPFWQGSRPEALVQLGRALLPYELPVATTRQWRERLLLALHQTQDALAALARRQNPADFAPLVDQQSILAAFWKRWMRGGRSPGPRRPARPLET